MKRFAYLLLLLLFALPAAGGAESLTSRLRPTHPRLFLTADDLPALRARAAGACAADFAETKRQVDALPADAPEILNRNLFTVGPDGAIKPDKPARQGATLFRYNGGDQAVRAALVYLVTGERQYLDKAKQYLRLAGRVFHWSAETAKLWVNWTNHVETNALAAYDWIYNDLTPEERRELLLPLLDYIRKARTPDGVYRYRRTGGGPQNGNYGENALQWFAGIAAAGDGIDDPLAEEFLQRGEKLFNDMLRYREDVSSGSGLLTAPTVTYSFSMYPFASFLYFHSRRAAFGEEIAPQWPQMADYVNWFDWAAIKLLPRRKFLSYGIGDLFHQDNAFSSTYMYTHLAQAIHFYAASRPERAAQCYAMLDRLPREQHEFFNAYAFVPYLLTGFDPARIDGAAGRFAGGGDRYFFAPAFGVLLMRSGTGEDDTFAAFRGGSKNSIHQHYDELSFILYKRGFLALDSGSRNESGHHVHYASQSVAHNTLLIHQPEEPATPFWKPWGYKPDGRTYFHHGGQSSTTAARTVALQSSDDFIYIAADATASYRDSKCREAVRQFVYLKPDLFVVYDRVESVRPDQRKEFLLHTQNEPVRLADNLWRTDNGGRLFVRTLLPEAAHVEVVGGPGNEFFASGRNWPVSERADWEKTYQVTGRWRLEISDPQPRTANRFLHLLQTTLPETAVPVDAQYTARGEFDELSLTDPSGVRWQLTFRRTGAVGLSIRQTRPDGTVVFDAALPDRIEKLPRLGAPAR